MKCLRSYNYINKWQRFFILKQSFYFQVILYDGLFYFKKEALSAAQWKKKRTWELERKRKENSLECSNFFEGPWELSRQSRFLSHAVTRKIIFLSVVPALSREAASQDTSSSNPRIQDNCSPIVCDLFSARTLQASLAVSPDTLELGFCEGDDRSRVLNFVLDMIYTTEELLASFINKGVISLSTVFVKVRRRVLWKQSMT